MYKVHGSEGLGLPMVAADELRRFEKAVTVRDASTFLAELDKFVREKVACAARALPAATLVAQVLCQKADALKASTPWEPSASALQRGRVALLREFGRPQNLSVAEFARLAHKSRQQVYRDIAAKRLLALNLGKRGQRLPNWQLDPAGRRLTQAVLARAGQVDAWTLYKTFLEPLDSLGGCAPAIAVRRGNVAVRTKAVLNALGIHTPEPVLAGNLRDVVRSRQS